MPPNPTTSTTEEPLIIETGQEYDEFILGNSHLILSSSVPDNFATLTAAMAQYIEDHPDREKNLNFAVLMHCCGQNGLISRELFADLLEDQFLNAYDERGNCLLFITVSAFAASWDFLKVTHIVDKHFFVLNELLRRGANIRKITDRHPLSMGESVPSLNPAQYVVKCISVGSLNPHPFYSLVEPNELLLNEIEEINGTIDRMLETLTQGYSINELQALIAPLKEEDRLRVPSILKRIQVGDAVIMLLFSTFPVPSTNLANKVQGLVRNDGDNSGMTRTMSYLL